MVDHRQTKEGDKSPSLVLTAEVKYSSRKIALKTARDGEKNMTHDSVKQIIATVLFIANEPSERRRSDGEAAAE